MPRRSYRVKGTFIFSATFLLLGAILFVRWQFDEPMRDPKTHCLLEPQQGQTIVFIDKTDLWNDNGAERLVDHVLRLVNERMRQEELLRVYIFGEKLTRGFEASFAACKPPVQVPNSVVDSAAYRRRKFEEVFGGPLRKLMEEAKKPEEGNCSPIAEVMVEVMTRAEVRHWIGPTRLVFFSDMAQNSSIYSAFNRTRCFAGNGQRDHTADVRPLIRYFERYRSMMNLEGASVIVYQVVPEKNPPRIRDLSKEKWGEVLRSLSIEAEWELL